MFVSLITIQAMAVTCMSLYIILLFNFLYFVKKQQHNLCCVNVRNDPGVNGTVKKEKRGFEPDLSALLVNLSWHNHEYIV